MVSSFLPGSRSTCHRQVTACLAPLCWCHGQAVTTVEGLGSSGTGLLPLQRQLAERGGVQCGFCTPGVVMSIFTLVRSCPGPSPPSLEDIQAALEGNLCRCTGYRGILDGLLEGVKQTQCCRQTEGGQGGCPCRGEVGDVSTASSGTPSKTEKECDSKGGNCVDQVAIFPPELKLQGEAGLETGRREFEAGGRRWIRPCCLSDLLQTVWDLPSAAVVGACCSLGVGRTGGDTLVAVGGVGELCQVQVSGRTVRLGAALSIASLLEQLRLLQSQLPEAEGRHLKTVVEMASKIGSPQIRSLGTIGGNLLGTQYPSDLRTVLAAVGADVTFTSKGGERVVSLWETAGQPLSSVIQKSEVLTHVTIPLSSQTEHSYGTKVQTRPGFDTATVNAALALGQEEEGQGDQGSKVKVARLALGGHFCPPGVALTLDLSPALAGKELTGSALNAVLETVNETLAKHRDKGESVSAYHHQLILGCVFELFSRHLGWEPSPAPPGGSYSSTRAFPPPPEGERGGEGGDPVGRPLAQLGGLHMACGETRYVDDLPRIQGELSVGLVLSQRCHARLEGEDWSEALLVRGVRGLLQQGDLLHQRCWAAGGVCDVPVLARGEVVYKGQIIGLVLADDEKTAKMAASLVKVTYSDLPALLTIEDAIAAKSYFTHDGACPELSVGDVDVAMAADDVTVATGETRFEGQEHWYLEPQSVLVVPGPQPPELEVHASSQCITGVQSAIASVLGIDANKVIVHANRLGGGFGGKDQQANIIAVPVAVAAHKYRKPVRCALDRSVDLKITGKRAPFLTKYKVGFRSDGTIVALEAELFLNAGWCVDLNSAILDYTVQHAMMSYRVPNVRIKGFLCKTNLPPNTAFRGFGLPESFLSSELIIDKVATLLGLPHTQVQLKNMHKEGDITYTHQTLSQCNLERCYQECREKSSFEERKKAVEDFNRENARKKRGMSIVPIMFPIGFPLHFLNQAGALVHVYLDGSVWVTHGGVEMGQGLHLKMLQVAARVLGVGMDRLHTSQVSTNLVPNSTATAGSFSSDLYGRAVKDACEQIQRRLAPLREEHPDLSWEALVTTAYFKRISLSAFGFHKTEKNDEEWSFKSNKGTLCDYYTYGAGCSEVEVDVLTGQHKVLRVDIVMDVGRSLNPSIDMGQVEGAFLQGYGMMMMEGVEVGADGTVMPDGLRNYKIPGVRNIPEQFNVSFLKDSDNALGIYSSKGVGEPPLLLAVSVLLAVKEAVRAGRRQRGGGGGGGGLEPDFPLHCPALPQQLLLALLGDGDSGPGLPPHLLQQQQQTSSPH